MKVLFINNGNINGIGGNTIQLVHELNMWSKENEIHYFSFAKAINCSNFMNLDSKVKVIFPNYKDIKHVNNSLSIIDYAKLTIALDVKEEYDLIICRGAKLNFELYKASKELYMQKVICYITDTNNIDIESFDLLCKRAKYVKCQHENYLAKFPQIYTNKVLIQPPIVLQEELNTSDKKYDIVYAGTIAKTWGVDLFLEFVAANPNINAAIAYTSFASVKEDELEYFQNLIFNTPNLTVFKALSNKETKKLFSESKVSFCYKDAAIDNDNSTEISTKLLESLELGCLPIVRDTKVHRSILGNSYAFYCGNDDDLDRVIKVLLSSEININNLKEISNKYYPETLYSDLIRKIKHNPEPKKVLFMNSASIDRIGGNLVQLSNELNMWSKFGNDVTFATFMKPATTYIPSLVNKNVKIIYPNYKTDDIGKLKLLTLEYVKMVLEIIEKENFDFIICRGALLNQKFLELAPDIYKEKVICYITDGVNIEKSELENIYANAKYIRCQHKNFMQKNPFVEHKKVLIQVPIVEKQIIEVKNSKVFDLVYAGSIEKLWKVNLFLDYVQKHPHIKAAIAYAKIVGYEGEELEKLNSLLTKTKNLTVYTSLSNEETKELLTKSKVSFCYRSEMVDNENSVEISTKLLESVELGCLPIVRDTPIHREILQNKLELCCENDDELNKKINYLIHHYEKFVYEKDLYSYYPEFVYQDIIEQIRRING